MDSQPQVWPVAGGYHATAPGLTINVYGKTREEAIRETREAEQLIMRLSLLVAARARAGGAGEGP